MISEVKMNAEMHAPNRMNGVACTMDGASTSMSRACAPSAQKTSWTKVCIDELVQSLALISKLPYR
jgi:hypothetical protein